MSNGQNSENAADGCSAHTPEKSLMASSIITQKNESPSWGSSKTPLNFNGQISKIFSPASTSSQPSTQSNASLIGDDESDEQVRLSQVGRKRGYTDIERVDGKQINVLKGLELHTKVFSAAEHEKIVDYVYKLQKMGQAGKLKSALILNHPNGNAVKDRSLFSLVAATIRQWTKRETLQVLYETRISVLILSGNGVDVAKHCVPGVPSKRISITFRKMDDSKSPYDFCPDPELKGLEPLGRTPSSIKLMAPSILQSCTHGSNSVLLNNQLKEMNNIVTPTNIDLGQYNFPALGSSNNRGEGEGPSSKAEPL
ncbi:hypothetical protein MKX01_033232 [Papaver californicum]|nr:hypothetical protein MKX01_033232 [Papaver californicum]